MNTNELNEFIKHYLEKDNTHSAILLTAPWGTGKSYYIKNELIPFIDTEEQRKCIVVSLYGLKNLQEISKSIYLEVRAKAITKKSEKLSASKIIGKTIVKGVASFFGVNLDISQDDLDNLYESIDLTGKLIVLEDLERCPISIIEVLGYVNSLVEQDGVKVLLVANENEILKYEDKEIIGDDSKDKSTKIIKVLSKESEKYLEVKEKTISDTIHFYCDTKNAIKEIISSFNNTVLDELLKDTTFCGESQIASDIYEEVMQNKAIRCENLRALIYACQKTVDILDSVNNELDFSFAKRTFLSIVAFALRKKQKDDLRWDSKLSYSQELGTYKYPLLDYCYYNISVQYTYPKALKEAEHNYIEQQKINAELERNNSDLDIIYSYYVKSEKEVFEAVKRIRELLKSTTAIYPTQYGKLSNYLIAIKHTIDCYEEVDDCKAIMLKNIPTVSCDELADRISFHDSMQLDGEAANEFKTFKDKMLETITQTHLTLFDFDYTVKNLQNFCDQVHDRRDKIITHRVFARKIDNERLINLLIKCNAYQIREIYGMYSSVYSFSNINEYFMDDKNAITDLRERISRLINSENKFDKIQILQLNWFLYNLDEIINKLQ